ncbi:response regulator transcription factor [Hazenella sp. IB182357]|uniref:Response regulator transcription factor n=1 Tax=Polycladospora coralii TaxID=2771432 RepID=A0A926N9H8_9BACL|nr:response regulator transcription factor [Polycladospora coralii]MBD1371862.1 response regulator transcription factor [Polycladospora coralii]MBS7529323.1 response regulator transcription factor [Polycladospora coralii]
MEPSISVLIGDDSEASRKAIRMILQTDPNLKIVGEAKDGLEVVQMAESLLPDLILMDINMPNMNGLEATRLIKDQLPHIKIIMVTVSDQISDLFEAIKKGAQGYLLKNLNPQIWIEYIHSIINEEAPMSAAIASRILHEFNEKPIISPNSGLTQREHEVLIQVAKGLSNKEIANTLFITEHTVKNHLKNIMQKLYLNNRAQLVRYAYEQGFMGK